MTARLRIWEFSVFDLMAFMRSLPTGLEEAARVVVTEQVVAGLTAGVGK